MLRAVPRSFARAARSFHPSAMPLMSRRSYRWELTSAFFVPMSLACVEGNVLGVIAKKAFDASDLVIALLAASPALANITSFLWSRLARGRDRVRVVNALQLGLIACVLLIACSPFNGVGIGMLVAGALLGRSFMAGILTVRADIWGANYRRQDRGRVTGKLATVATIIVSSTALTIGWAMDSAGALGEDAFRVIYIAAGVASMAGVWAFSNIRWRRAQAVLRVERAEESRAEVTTGPRSMLRILRDDRTYRRYQTGMFVMGLPNLAVTAPFVIAFVEIFQRDYAESILLTQIIPFLTPILVIPIWARLLDRTHIIRFRAIHSWFFVVANVAMGVSILSENLPLVYASRVVLGIAFGGGMLAWNIGHLDFARQGLGPIYMGIHVTLTGVRGAIGPFIGTLLYTGFSLRVGDSMLVMPALKGWTFLVMAAVSFAGAVMFVRLHLDTRADAQRPPGDG